MQQAALGAHATGSCLTSGFRIHPAKSAGVKVLELLTIFGSSGNDVPTKYVLMGHIMLCLPDASPPLFVWVRVDGLVGQNSYACTESYGARVSWNVRAAWYVLPQPRPVRVV